MRARSVTLTAYSVANITNPNFTGVRLGRSKNAPVLCGVEDIGPHSFTRDVTHVRRFAQLVAAFDREALAGYPRRLGAGEVSNRRCDVGRRTGATQRLLHTEPFHERFVRMNSFRIYTVGLHQPGSHGVHADLQMPEFVRRDSYQ